MWVCDFVGGWWDRPSTSSPTGRMTWAIQRTMPPMRISMTTAPPPRHTIQIHPITPPPPPLTQTHLVTFSVGSRSGSTSPILCTSAPSAAAAAAATSSGRRWAAGAAVGGSTRNERAHGRRRRSRGRRNRRLRCGCCGPAIVSVCVGGGVWVCVGFGVNGSDSVHVDVDIMCGSENQNQST